MKKIKNTCDGFFNFVVKIGRKTATECLIPGGGSGFQAGSSSSSSGATRPARIVEAAGGSPEPRGEVAAVSR